MAHDPNETTDEWITRIVRARQRDLLEAGSKIGGGNENVPFRFHHQMLAHMVLELAPVPHLGIDYHEHFLVLVLRPLEAAFPGDTKLQRRALARLFREHAIANNHDR